jgi:hypothetical protein
VPLAVRVVVVVVVTVRDGVGVGSGVAVWEGVANAVVLAESEIEGVLEALAPEDSVAEDESEVVLLPLEVVLAVLLPVPLPVLLGVPEPVPLDVGVAESVEE